MSRVVFLKHSLPYLNPLWISVFCLLPVHPQPHPPVTEIITAVCFEPWTFSCTGPSAQKPCLTSPFYLTLVLHPFRLWLRHPIFQEVYLPLSPARWNETCSLVLMRPPMVPLAQHLPRSAIILSLSASCSRLELGVRGRQRLSLIWVGIHSTSDRAWHTTGTH